MVRRSARKQNLSQDMMAETIDQANHCFSISAQTKYTHQPSTNTDMIILPEWQMQSSALRLENLPSTKSSSQS
jgi:hypothetical protein